MEVTEISDIPLIEDRSKRHELAQAYRLNNLQEVQGDEELQEAIMQICKDKPKKWIDDWAWTYNPKGEGEDQGEGNPDVPFILYPYQRDYIDWLEDHYQNKNNGLIEKSRTMGLTWLMAAYFVHKWLFEPGFTGSVGSYEAENVDMLGDLDSFMQKCRFILKNLPQFMLPDGFEVRGDYDNEKRIVNPGNSARILGRVGAKMGRGGRSSIFFMDEFAHFDHPKSAQRSVSQNASCIIYGSTPNGRGNLFSELRHDQLPEKDIFSMHWSEHPHYDREWYEKQKEKYGGDPVLIAQELDIDYSASVEDVCIKGYWSQTAVDYHIDNAVGKTVAGFDVAGPGENKNVYIKRTGLKVEKIESWAGDAPEDSALKANRMAREDGVEVLKYDRGGLGQSIGSCFNGDFEVVPMDSSSSPSSEVYPFSDGRKAEEMFSNVRAEMWWKLRTHLRYTYELTQTDKENEIYTEWAVDLPQHSDMLAELSYPKVERGPQGKIRLEKKSSMRSRGIKSPDYGDALALCFANPVTDGTEVILSW